MEGILRVVNEQPLVALLICAAFLLLLYFFLKSLVKLLFIGVLIAIVAGGIYYIKDPESRPASLKDGLESTRTHMTRTLDRGQEAFRKGREMVHKGRELIDEAKTFFSNGADRGKAAEGKDHDTGKTLKADSKTDVTRRH